ncbi:MAG: class D sortase [Chloroflexota bacterium]
MSKHYRPMSKQKPAEALSVAELERLLREKKAAQRDGRLERLRKNGRLVQHPTLTPPPIAPPPLPRVNARPTGALRHYSLDDEEAQPDDIAPTQRVQWRWVFNKVLLAVEILAVLGLAVVLWGLWDTNQELNQELAQVQRQESQAVALPTPTATPIIDIVVLPSGHKPPIDGRPPEPGEAGDIPAHLLPAVQSYQPPPVPTPSAEQARRIQIPAIGVDHPVVQGDDWEQLKKGVGQHVGSAQAGGEGNLVLSAHNDIYGEIFRYLDQLAVGDEIIVSTERQSYIYVVRELQVVEPTDVWVMADSDHASATLISCYPFRVNNKRIVVFADLAVGGQS